MQTYTSSGGAYSQATIQTAAGNAGGANTLDVLGKRLLIGSPSSASSAGAVALFDASTGNSLNLSLHPFWVKDNKMASDPTAGRQFGVGGSIISEGHYVVGSDPTDSNLSQILYNFRQRGPAWTEQGAPVLPHQLATAKFGTSIAVDGRTAVVGAQDYDDRGAAFVFVQQDSGTWQLQAKLQGAGINRGDQFGASVAISGDTIVVGGGVADNAWVFQRSGSAWTEQVKLSSAFNGFGSAVAIDIDHIAVGAGASNRAFMYELSNGSWIQTGAFTGSGGFGGAVAVDGDTVVVGAADAAGDNGAAYVYTDIGATWQQQGFLSLGSDGRSGDRFGEAVDVSGDWIIVGAPGANSAGAAYLFHRDLDENGAPVWTKTDRLVELDHPAAGDQFGHAVAIDGERAIVGAFGRDRDGTDKGEAQAYGYKYGAWRQETAVNPLYATDTESGDQLGYSVALSGNIAMLGAPQLNGRPGLLIDTPGAGYVYMREVSPPTTVTQPVRDDVLLNGARANTVSGTVGGTAMAELSFFDIRRVTVRTGAADDTVTIGADGLTALGLQNFTVATGAGDDQLNVLSTSLNPPGAESFDADLHAVAGHFSFDGGTGTDQIVASGNQTEATGLTGLGHSSRANTP